MARDRLALLRAQQQEAHTRGSSMQAEITRPQSMPVRSNDFYPPHPSEGGGHCRTIYDPSEVSRVHSGYAPYWMSQAQGRYPSLIRGPYDAPQLQSRFVGPGRTPYEVSHVQNANTNTSRRPHGMLQPQSGYSEPPRYYVPHVQNPVANTSSRPYEMSQLQSGYSDPHRHSDTSAFYSEISSIQDSLRTFNDNISRISDLHSRSLNNVDGSGSHQQARQLDELIEETSKLGKQLKARIKALQKKVGGGRDGEIRKQQAGLVRQRFMDAINNYQRMEQQYRSKYKKRIERQIKTVKPDVTPEEIKQVLNSGEGIQIFTQALQSSNRYGESRAVYLEVKERHEDIKKIERTLGELARLFNDMSLIIEENEEKFDDMEVKAINIEKRAEVALRQTKRAISSARSRRKRRWMCIIIFTTLILTILGTVIGVVVSNMNNNNNNDNNGW